MRLRPRFVRLACEAVLLALAISLIPAVPANTSAQQQPAPTQGPMILIGRYRGVLPCADCSGIDTELALYAKSPNEFVNTRYVMKLTYQKGRGPAKTLAESGSWVLLRGTPDDPNATVYQLTESKNGQLTNFLKVGANQLELLDKDQHRLPSRPPHTISRVLPSQDK